MSIKIRIYPEISYLQKEINKIFEHFFNMSSSSDKEEAIWVPLVDCYETNDSIVFKIELPGVNIENIILEIRQEYLYIEGYKEKIRTDCSARFLQIERNFGKFSRYIPINTTIDTNSSSAILKNGMLIVRLKKLKERRRSAIRIKITTEEKE